MAKWNTLVAKRRKERGPLFALDTAVSDITKTVEDLAKMIGISAKELSWALLDRNIDSTATHSAIPSAIVSAFLEAMPIMVAKINDFPPMDTRELLRDSLDMIIKEEKAREQEENPTIYKPVRFPNNADKPKDKDIGPVN